MSAELHGDAQSNTPDSGPRLGNRLTVGHFLLWMATTGLVLANLQSQKPTRAEDIGSSSFLHSAGMTEEEVKLEYRRQQ